MTYLARLVGALGCPARHVGGRASTDMAGTEAVIARHSLTKEGVRALCMATAGRSGNDITERR